jgi:hypothetical protein
MLKRVEPLRDELHSLEVQAHENQNRGEEVTNLITQLEHSIASYKEEYAQLISQAQAIKTDLENVQAKVLFILFIILLMVVFWVLMLCGLVDGYQCSSKMLVTTFEITQYHNSEDHHLDLHCCENIRSHMLIRSKRKISHCCMSFHASCYKKRISVKKSKKFIAMTRNLILTLSVQGRSFNCSSEVFGY